MSIWQPGDGSLMSCSKLFIPENDAGMIPPAFLETGAEQIRGRHSIKMIQFTNRITSNMWIGISRTGCFKRTAEACLGYLGIPKKCAVAVTSSVFITWR
jgi:hypothetical protein